MEQKIDDILKKYKCLYERDYENEVTKLVAEGLESKEIDDLINIIDNHLEDDFKFTAFLALFTFLRRDKKGDETKSLIKKHTKQFSESYPLFKHVELLDLSLRTYDEREMYDLIRESKKLSEKEIFKDHKGVLHHYARIVANYFELSKKTLDEIRSDSRDMEFLSHAYESINICIKNEDYPKFYSTKGRIEILLGKYDDAVQSLHTAKSLEDFGRKDYTLIINSYQDYLLFAKQLKLAKELEEKQQKIEEKLNGVVANNMKIVGLFAGLISLILGNISFISNSDRPFELMLIFNLSFFIYFGIILMIGNILGNEKTSKNIHRTGLAVMITGVVLVVGLLIVFIFMNKGII